MAFCSSTILQLTDSSYHWRSLIIHYYYDASCCPVSIKEFELDVEALDDLLRWLVSAAARLKAMTADTAGSAAGAAREWAVPEGLLPPVPDTAQIAPVSKRFRFRVSGYGNP
jgi:hypothetical protein